MKTNTVVILNTDGTLNTAASTAAFLKEAQAIVAAGEPLRAEAQRRVSAVFDAADEGDTLGQDYILTKALATEPSETYGSMRAAIVRELSNDSRYAVVRGAAGGRKRL